MAANMIGQRKRIIAFADGTTLVAMLNPRILERAGAFETEEGCLSLPGVRPATRYRTIKVGYQDLQLKQRVKSFLRLDRTDYPARNRPLRRRRHLARRGVNNAVCGRTAGPPGKAPCPAPCKTRQ